MYASQTTLQQPLSSPAYQNQIASAYISTYYSDWKLEADRARGDLANIIADAVGRGVNPRETAQVISKRLMSLWGRAKTIAQTEQVGALRQAQWNETDWAADRLGLEYRPAVDICAQTDDAQLGTPAVTAKVYTTEQVRDFYAENGNRVQLLLQPDSGTASTTTAVFSIKG